VVAAAAAVAEGGEGSLEKSVTTRAAARVYTLVSKTTSLTRGENRAVKRLSLWGGGGGGHNKPEDIVVGPESV